MGMIDNYSNILEVLYRSIQEGSEVSEEDIIQRLESSFDSILIPKANAGSTFEWVRIDKDTYTSRIIINSDYFLRMFSEDDSICELYAVRLIHETGFLKETELFDRRVTYEDIKQGKWNIC